MKKIIIFSLFVLITSCSTFTNQWSSVVVNGYDFAPFTAEGFMFTPLEYKDKYESIGLIEIEIKPMITNDNQAISKYKGEKSFDRVGSHFIEKIEVQDILEAAKEKASEMGANALTLVKIRNGVPSINSQTNNEYYTVYVSGFAIKRKW
mgnify:CR=1 FL=1